MPNIKSRAFFDGVTEIVVPGQIRTSPPRNRRNTVVSAPAVTDDPLPIRVPDTTTEPLPPPAAGTSAGVVVTPSVGTDGVSALLSALVSPGGLRRIISRLPAPSQVYP